MLWILCGPHGVVLTCRIRMEFPTPLTCPSVHLSTQELLICEQLLGYLGRLAVSGDRQGQAEEAEGKAVGGSVPVLEGMKPMKKKFDELEGLFGGGAAGGKKKGAAAAGAAAKADRSAERITHTVDTLVSFERVKASVLSS